MTLEVWPAIPIVIDFVVVPKLPRDMGNIIAALEQNNRVSKIKIQNIPNSLLEQFAVMKKPFPALTELDISSRDGVAPLTLSSFLGGPMPQLRSLMLAGIAFPSLPKLLLSASDLVELGLWRIPHSGYISPQAMVIGLSTLTRLKTLFLEFRFPRSRDDRATRHAPPLTRVVLPSLATLYFEGESEYLEDTLFRIDTPLLDCIKITFLNQLMFDTPLLGNFIGRTETFTAVHQADVVFRALGVQITLSRRDETPNNESLTLLILCKPSDWQLSSVAQVCNSIIPPLPTLRKLSIDEGPFKRLQWHDDMENTQWLELLRPFSRVKKLVLSRELVRPVAPALQELAGEGLTEVLPMLRSLHIAGPLPSPSGSVWSMFYKFITARRDSPCPITVRGVLEVAYDGPLDFYGERNITQPPLSHGADANALDSRGDAPVFTVLRSREFDVTEHLLKCGADGNTRDKDNSTPLHEASACGYLGAAEMLLSAGADVNALDHRRDSALHRALRSREFGIAELLVKSGANVNARNKYNSTPLHEISENWNLNVAKLLLSHGADVNARGWRNRTPLHVVSFGGSLDVSRFLIEHGAVVDAQDDEERTPFSIALANGHRKLAQFLSNDSDPTDP